MGICKPLFLACVCLAVSASANAASPESFLREHHAPEDVITHMLNSYGQVRRCLSNDGQLLCLQGRSCPNVSSNARSRQAILQGLGLSVRNDVYVALTSKIKARHLLNGQAVSQAFLTGLNQGHITLTGVEWTTFCRGDWCGAIAAISLHVAEKEVPSIYEGRPFIVDYCQTLLPKARELMAKEKSAEALVVLKELYDLQFADIQAYLLTVQAFILEKQPAEAARIACELLDDFAHTMDAEQAEELGDILITLDMPDKAERAYNIAIMRMEQVF